MKKSDYYKIHYIVRREFEDEMGKYFDINSISEEDLKELRDELDTCKDYIGEILKARGCF